MGHFQILWDTHKDTIKKLTGVASKEQFEQNFNAQQTVLDYFEKDYDAHVPELQSQFGDVKPEMLKMLQHFLGLKDTKTYLSEFQQAIRNNFSIDEAYNKAQQALSSKVTNNNMTVRSYLDKFQQYLNR